MSCLAVMLQAEEKLAERVEREATEVYAAIRPDGTEAAWPGPIPELRPTLRPYQSRALAWMVQRERAAQVFHPLLNLRQITTPPVVLAFCSGFAPTFSAEELWILLSTSRVRML